MSLDTEQRLVAVKAAVAEAGHDPAAVAMVGGEVNVTLRCLDAPTVPERVAWKAFAVTSPPGEVLPCWMHWSRGYDMDDCAAVRSGEEDCGVR